MLGYGSIADALCWDITFRNNYFDNVKSFNIYSAKNITIENNYFYTEDGNYSIALVGGDNQTSDNHIDYIHIRNNTMLTSGAYRAIRLNPNAGNFDIHLIVENNIVSSEHSITSSVNVQSNNIQLINQSFDNDFYFASTYGFKPYTINGQTVTTS